MEDQCASELGMRKQDYSDEKAGLRELTRLCEQHTSGVQVGSH
jgi:hypothetical protein